MHKLNGTYLTMEEAAKKLGVTEGRIRQLVLAGELPAETLSDRIRLIPAQAIQKLKLKPRGRRPKSAK